MNTEVLILSIIFVLLGGLILYLWKKEESSWKILSALGAALVSLVLILGSVIKTTNLARKAKKVEKDFGKASKTHGAAVSRLEAREDLLEQEAAAEASRAEALVEAAQEREISSSKHIEAAEARRADAEKAMERADEIARRR